MSIELREGVYTVIGKYGCCFTEVCLKILDKTEHHIQQQLKRALHMFFEDPFEHQIELLKKKLPKGPFSASEVDSCEQNSASPCVFFGHQFVGGFQELQAHFNAKYEELELNENAALCVDPAETRMSVHINSSPNTFIKVGILDEDHEDYGPHHINIELFSEDLPLTTGRFLALSQGKNGNPAHPGYLETSCSRIQKRDFLQFGKISGLPSDYPVLADERFIFDHSQPGMIGFVGGKTSHTNKTEFYITLSSVPSFDKLYVVFGRVVEGLSFLKKIAEKQDPHSLLPNSRLLIKSMAVCEKVPSAETLRRQAIDASRRPAMPLFASFANHADILSFVQHYKQQLATQNFVKGPEVVEIKNLESNDDLYVLAELPLSHVHTVSFRDCKFHLPSQAKLFKQSGFFMNVLHWEFYGCSLSKEVLKTFFINKHTKPVQSLVVEPLGDGIDLFKILVKWRKLENLKRLAYLGSKINKEELDLLQQSAVFTNLEFLDLSHTKFYDEAFLDFATKFNNPKIRGLYLQNTGLTDKVIAVLLKNKSLAHIEVLDISNNFGMDPIVNLLAESKQINNLRELYLRNTYLSIASLFEYLNSQNFSTIQKLDVSNNFALKDDFSVALIDKPFVRKLELLNLDNCDVSNETVKYLCENRHLKSLAHLDLSNNKRVSFAKLVEEPEQMKFLQSLKAIHVAGIAIDLALFAELKNEYKVCLDNSSLVAKDYSDIDLYLKKHKEVPRNEEFEAQVRDVFNEFDADKSNHVSLSEIKTVLEKIFGVEFNLEQLQPILDKFDTNKSGSLEFLEFKQLCYECLEMK